MILLVELVCVLDALPGAEIEKQSQVEGVLAGMDVMSLMIVLLHLPRVLVVARTAAGLTAVNYRPVDWCPAACPDSWPPPLA